VARSDGTGLRKLTAGATPRWSPDGGRLLFIRGEEQDPDQEPNIFTIRPDGSREQKITRGRWPDWSPGGKQLVFSRGGEPGGGARLGSMVVIAGSDGSHPEELFEG